MLNNATKKKTESELTFKQYQQGLEKNRLLSLLCKDCDEHMLPPQGVCSKCGSQALVVEEIDNQGVIKTFTVIRVAAKGMEPPFVVALVETSSGAWVAGNLVGIDPEKADMTLMDRPVRISNRVVKGDIYAQGDIRALTFELA